jgi:hypothetical protein
MHPTSTTALLASLPHRIVEARSLHRALKIVALRAPHHHLIEVIERGQHHHDLVFQLTEGPGLCLVVGSHLNGSVQDALLLEARPDGAALPRLRGGQGGQLPQGVLAAAGTLDGQSPSHAA